MPLLNKSPSQITENDLLALVAHKEAEGKTLEYKRDTVGNGDSERKEFLYDATSFANTEGGYLIFGMGEADGLPTSLVGLAKVEADRELLRLEHMLRDGVRPPISGIETAPVSLASGNVAIVMRIPKSGNPPHQVTYQKAFRFFARGSNGKYPIDVDELRSAFSNTEKARRPSEARRYLAPELNRTIDRVLYIHGRAIANFVCASAEHGIKPNDRKEDFIPHWPTLYPNAAPCRDLAADDAAALIAFYDSLRSLADFVNDWWEREGQLPVNIFNMILHHAHTSLELAPICVEKFDLETLCPPPYESWGTISSRIERSLAAAADARRRHIARFEAEAANKAPPPLQRRGRA